MAEMIDIYTISMILSLGAMVWGAELSSRDPWWDILTGCGWFVVGAVGMVASLPLKFS